MLYGIRLTRQSMHIIISEMDISVEGLILTDPSMYRKIQNWD